jgi:hypothetical protein
MTGVKSCDSTSSPPTDPCPQTHPRGPLALAWLVLGRLGVAVLLLACGAAVRAAEDLRGRRDRDRSDAPWSGGW